MYTKLLYVFHAFHGHQIQKCFQHFLHIVWSDGHSYLCGYECPWAQIHGCNSMDFRKHLEKPGYLKILWCVWQPVWYVEPNKNGACHPDTLGPPTPTISPKLYYERSGSRQNSKQRHEYTILILEYTYHISPSLSLSLYIYAYIYYLSIYLAKSK